MQRIVMAVALLAAVSLGQIDTLMTENFDAAWRTNNPPTGWSIFHTGPRDESRAMDGTPKCFCRDLSDHPTDGQPARLTRLADY
jgi:hypothetical protein